MAESPAPEPSPVGAAASLLTLILVTYDSARHLPALAASLAPELLLLPGAVEIVVVDNASQDDSVSLARALWPEAILLLNQVNVGYGRGANRGWQVSRGQYVLVMNPDVVVHEGSLSILLKSLQEHPDAGLVAPKLLNSDGSLQASCRRFYTFSTVLFQRTILGKWAPGRRGRNKHLMEDLDRSHIQEVDWVTGAVMLLPRDAVSETGPFDPRYFLYFEDVDLCYRLKRQGRPTLYVPDAVMTHHHGRASRRLSLFNPDLGHHLVSYGRFLVKWSPLRYALRGGLAVSRGLLSRGIDALGAGAGMAVLGGTMTTSPWIAGGLTSLLRLILAPSPNPSPVPRWPGRPLLFPGLLGASLAWGGVGGWDPLLRAFMGSILGSLGVDAVMHRLVVRVARAGFQRKAAAVVGSGTRAVEVARLLRQSPASGLDPLGFIPVDPMDPVPAGPVLCPLADLAEGVRLHRLHALVLAASDAQVASLLPQILPLREQGVELWWVLSPEASLLAGTSTVEVGGAPSVAMGGGPGFATRVATKRVLDVVLSLAILPVALLFLLPLLLLCRTVFGTSAVVREEHLGKEEKPFLLLRLRTFREGEAREEGGGRLGVLLRSLRFDELPQFIQVLKGEMSLVGPRPRLAREAMLLQPWERTRFLWRPGMTGLWQVESDRRWRFDQMVATDLQYLLEWSLRLDLAILVRSLARVVRGR